MALFPTWQPVQHRRLEDTVSIFTSENGVSGCLQLSVSEMSRFGQGLKFPLALLPQ